jgi:hypothetical protein
MGELTGDLANERAEAMDYYYGEPTGQLFQPNEDRSRVVITTLRDTVEWMMPQLMRLFAQADAVVTFEATGSEDEEAAEQETQAINHIFWRQNEGFLLLYTWFKDALLQKNGTVKYWIDESEERDREEYDGLTDIALSQLVADDEYEVLEHEPSEVQSMDGQALHHVVLERTSKQKTIHVANVPPEEFLISDDAKSLDVQTKRPRMTGHHTDKTRNELKDMGFSNDAIEQMMKSDDESERYDEEWVARYNYSDEQQILQGGTDYGHESQRKTRLYELYMDLDRNGDGYAELLKIYYAGDYLEAEECDYVPFACLTPYINPHKHHGLSQYDMVHDLQEIATQVFRNVLDNMYQTNNVRPVVNENVDLDSLLVSRPGAPIYTETTGPVGQDVTSFAPPPMWKDGLEVMEYVETIRKDRTGIGDDTLGLTADNLANVNTGVLLEAMEAARGKIELVARIFAETGIKWLFRGIHELARKSYDQELRYELGGQYVEVNPQEWRKRTSITVNVGTASGSQQRELMRLAKTGEIQEKMVAGGGLGVTILPMHIYKTAKETVEALGAKDGDQYFLDPMLLQDPQVQQLVAMQLPQQEDPQAGALAMAAQAEQGKVEAAREKNQMEFEFKQGELQIKQGELALKREELVLRENIEALKAQLTAIQADAKNQTQMGKVAADAQAKEVANMIKHLEVQLSAAMDKYRTDIQSATQIGTKAMDVGMAEMSLVDQAEARAEQARIQADQETQKAQRIRDETDRAAADVQNQRDKLEQAASQSAQATEQLQETQRLVTAAHEAAAAIRAQLDAMDADMKKPREIKRDKDGRPVAIGDRRISYNSDGTIKQIG